MKRLIRCLQGIILHPAASVQFFLIFGLWMDTIPTLRPLKHTKTLIFNICLL